MECRSVTRRAPASREVESHGGSVCASAARPIGFYRCGCPSPVSMRRALPDADRPLVAKPASFSRVASPPQSSFISTPAQGLSALRPPARVSSLFAAPPKASNFRVGAQPIVSSALRLSQPLDGLLRLRLCGSIPSRSHVQGCLSRGFSLRAATFPLREEIPPCRLGEAAASLVAGSTGNAPRLRGFAPHGDAFFQDGVEPVPSAAPLFSFLLLQVSFPAVSPVTRAIHSWRFPMKLTSSRRLQRLVSEKAGRPVSRLPTCSRFRAVRCLSSTARLTVAGGQDS